jgi:ABC-2 type transport system permease protein
MSRLIRAELLKIFTTRLWWGLLIGVLATAALFAGVLAAVSGRGGQAGVPALDDPATIRSVYTTGLGVSRLIMLAFGIIAMSGEYRHQTITSTVLASPHRLRIVIAKLIAVTITGVGYGCATVIAGVGVGAPIVAARGAAVRLTSDGIPRALLLTVLAVALWGVIGLGIGTLIRNQIVALLVSIGVAWLVEPILVFILDLAHAGEAAKFFPSAATNALATPPTSSGGFTSTLLPWWGGALVLLMYAAVSGVLGAAITLRRDIT